MTLSAAEQCELVGIVAQCKGRMLVLQEYAHAPLPFFRAKAYEHMLADLARAEEILLGEVTGKDAHETAPDGTKDAPRAGATGGALRR